MMQEPGRSCPVAYRTSPEALATLEPRAAETLYVIGGLYGNRQALDDVEALAAREEAKGLPRPTLVFNGDFNWFNAEPAAMAEINDRVLAYTALQGNVETELADPEPGAGCGCAYPEWVDNAMVGRSNRIIEHLKGMIESRPDLRDKLGALPRQLRFQVGECRVGVIHGDPESLAGWGLAVEAMPAPGQGDATIESWFQRAAVDAFACTHTCLPFMQRFDGPGGDAMVLNNGAAGMPNFEGERSGLVTRISRHPSPVMPVYGTVCQGVHMDTLAIEAVTPEWLDWFESLWPPGSPAFESYHQRLLNGPSHSMDRACRVSR
ncbi:metallophosphoesterase family protein [Halospina denitrificans]|nr:hypothetical protein [Halospina denitrificans]